MHTDYHTTAASATDEVVDGDGRGSGRREDYLAAVLIIPLTESPGVVTLKDGATTRILYAGTTVGSAAFNVEKVPSYLPLGFRAKSAAGFTLTTGLNVEVMSFGEFK